MTRDEALQMFKKEIEKDESDLLATHQRMINLRKDLLINPLAHSEELEQLRIHQIIVEERLKSYNYSVDRLVEEMTNAYL